jgi:DNA-binding response OmpR family regulator
VFCWSNDDEDHARLVTTLLARARIARFIVDRAANGRDALRSVAERRYDAMVLDYRLGSEDGLTLLENLRQAGAEAPALLFTSAAPEEVTARALRARADDYMPKHEGLSGNALARALWAMIERRNLTRDAQRAIEEAARLQGVLVAANTMEHYLNNQLVLTVGYCELLAMDPRLPPDLREKAVKAMEGAMAAAATLNKLRQITEYVETSAPGGPMLDLGELTT